MVLLRQLRVSFGAHLSVAPYAAFMSMGLSPSRIPMRLRAHFGEQKRIGVRLYEHPSRSTCVGQHWTGTTHRLLAASNSGAGYLFRRANQASSTGSHVTSLTPRNSAMSTTDSPSTSRARQNWSRHGSCNRKARITVAGQLAKGLISRPSLLRTVVWGSQPTNHQLKPVAAPASPGGFPHRPDSDVLSGSISLFFIARNRSGLWIAREAEGRTGGIFLLRKSALQFAEKNSGKSGSAIMFLTESSGTRRPQPR